jgi:hypothetical protein
VEDSVDNDKPLLPSSDDWEERVAELLRGEEVDTDLGRRMARDAIRVARGELSDKEFNDRYRDEVLEVFEQGDWPEGAKDQDTGPDSASDRQAPSNEQTEQPNDDIESSNQYRDDSE